MKVALTRQQCRVLKLIFEGKSSQAAADLLLIHPKTVEFHLTRAYGRLCASNRMEARNNAERLGLLPLIEAGGRRP